MEWAHNRRLEELAQDNQALALLGTDWLVSKTGEKRPDFDRYNPYGKILKVMEARKIISPEVAETFKKVSISGLIPPWVFQALGDKIDMIELVSKNE